MRSTAPLALVPAEQRERLKSLHGRCLDPGRFSYSTDLLDAEGSVLTGWAEPERHGAHSYRYAQAVATLLIRNKVSARRLCLEVMGYPPEAPAATGRNTINGIEALRYELPSTG